MKQIIYFLAYISILFTNISWAEGKTPAQWGYLLHSSTLTDNYLKTVISQYTVICITGFKITETCEIAVESREMLERIRVLTAKNRVTIYPLLSFRSAVLGHRILNSMALREKTAGKISGFARSNGFTGIHLDFEYLPPEDSNKLGEFLTALKRIYTGTVSMAVFPPIGFPEKWSRFHDLGIISSLVDEIVLMCYDYHGIHSGPGPVTDVQWADMNIRSALAHMKSSRIWLGIPAYGYRWCNGRPTALSARQGIRLAEKNAPVRDPSGNLRFTYNHSGRRCTVYISDKQTRLLLQKLSIKHDLAGTALWRIGFDD